MKRLLRLTFGRSDIARDVEREIALHLELRTAELVAAGLSPGEARRRAEEAFGDVDEVARACRGIRYARARERSRRNMMDAMMQDLRYALRVLARAPGFTLTALVTLALGIGATTALFAIVHTLLLRPLPYATGDRLVVAREANPVTGESGWGVSLPLGRDLTGARTLEAAGMYRTGLRARIRIDDAMTRVNGVALQHGAFEALGARPLLGRLTTEEEDERGTAVAILSYGLWQRAFGGAQDIIGRTIDIGARPTVIVGVMPAPFSFPTDQTDFWTAFQRMDPRYENRAVHILGFIAARRAGVSEGGVASELQQIYERGQRDEPGSDPGHRMEIQSLRDALVDDVRPSLLLLFGAVVVVLLVACTNLAGLQIARAAQRDTELAVRVALAAGRWAIVRQVLVEALVLSAAGCACGLLVAKAMMPWLIATYPDSLPFAGRIALGGPVLAFAVGSGRSPSC